MLCFWDTFRLVERYLGRSDMSTRTQEQQDRGRQGPFYAFFVDGEELRIDEPTITGGKIMDLAGIPREVGLILLVDDGTQRTVDPDEVFELKPGRRFKRAPRFKRG
jgi:hypothetical protein